MYAKGFAVLGLSAVATSNAKGHSDIRSCKSYLKANEWKYLAKHGIEFPSFCCQVGFAKYCYDKWRNNFHQRGSKAEVVTDGAAAEPHVSMEILSEITTLKDAFSYCVGYAGLDKLSIKYFDHGHFSNPVVSLGKAEGQLLSMDAQNGYVSKCSHASNYHFYVVCTFEEYFQEVVDACYCHYRRNLGCTFSACREESKNVNIDIYQANQEPIAICNQCPHQKEDVYTENFRQQSSYGGGYGYAQYVEGSPFDPCTPYCILAAPAFADPLSCPSLMSPANGTVKAPVRRIGGLATYSCDDGFFLDGTTTRTCQTNGEWSGSAPTCNQLLCPRLENPRNGIVDITGTSEGDTATFSCNVGFRLDGPVELVCVNGGWDGSPPTCEPVCPPLPAPENGSVIIMETSVGDTATFSCSDGFMLNGPATLECANGAWSGSPPVCDPVVCPTLSSPNNGSVAVAGTSVGDTATFTCDSGFMLNGPATLVCALNGGWGGSPPTCDPVV